MSTDWTTKEKIVLLSDILEYGDQPESWSAISTDLSRTFQTTKKEGRYSTKNCKQEYKYLVDRYKSQWIEHGSSNGLKVPLAKYIWIQLKSIYRAELTFQLNESRKKLTEFCLRLETAVNLKSNIIESIIPSSSSSMEITTPIIISQQIEQHEEKTPIKMEIISESTHHPTLDIPLSEPMQSALSSETTIVPSISDNLKEETPILSPTIPPQIIDLPQIKEEAQIQPPIDIICNNNTYQPSTIVSPNPKQNITPIEQDISYQIPIDCSSLNIPSDQQPSLSPIATSITPSISITTTTTIPESASSSRSTSRTSSETKIDIVKIIPSTTPKYHVYFSPKNSISNNSGINKMKPKRKVMDDIKDENEIDSTIQQDTSPTIPSLSTEQSKVSSTTAPITRRSINTRSVPNSAVEQEEERSRRFSSMLSENPHSWQSQAMAIIQFILGQKQGYLFEHEITDEIAPKYHQFIRHPIALDTIRKTLESNGYQTKDYFKRDVYLMLYNAMKYNPRFHHVHRSAKHLFIQTLSLFELSSQEIHGQIAIRNAGPLPTTTTTNDTPPAKRKRIK